jgi:esterase
VPSSTPSEAALAADRQLQSLRRAAVHFQVPLDEVVLPVDAHVLLDSIRIHYLDWSNAGGPDVVFLHGMALTAHTWDLVCLSLRDEYRCLALDLRGHGDSEWPADRSYGIEQNARDIEAFVAALELERPIVVGMSMGGMAALQYAVDHGDSLAALVLVDVGTSPPRTEGLDRLRSFVTMEHEHDSFEGFIDQAMRFNPRRDPDLLRGSLTHSLRRMANGRWTWKYDRQHAVGGSAEQHAETMRKIDERLSSITCPTLIVRGAESDLFFDEDAEAMAERIPNARWVQIPGAGHTVQGDNPRDLAEALRVFFAELRG